MQTTIPRREILKRNVKMRLGLSFAFELNYTVVIMVLQLHILPIADMTTTRQAPRTEIMYIRCRKFMTIIIFFVFTNVFTKL